MKEFLKFEKFRRECANIWGAWAPLVDAHEHLLNVPEYRSIGKKGNFYFSSNDHNVIVRKWFFVFVQYEIKSRKRNSTTHIDRLRADEGAIKNDIIPRFEMLVYIMQQQKKSLKIISCVLCLVLFLVQIAVQLPFCLLVLLWFFASYQILRKGCMISSRGFLGCTTTKNIKEHWCTIHALSLSSSLK